MERQDTDQDTYQAFGVETDIAAQAGRIAEQQAQDPTYTLSNQDHNVINAAYQQMFQQQLDHQLQQQQEEESLLDLKVNQYVRLLDQAQESGSLSLLDEAQSIKDELIFEGTVTPAEFDERVKAEGEELQIMQERVEEVAPILVYAMNQTNSTEINESVFNAQWEWETGTLVVTDPDEHPILNAQWIGEKWIDQGSDLTDGQVAYFKDSFYPRYQDQVLLQQELIDQQQRQQRPPSKTTEVEL